MIIVTGGAGFIGSVLVWRLNQMGQNHLLIADRFGSGAKWRNINKRRFSQLIHKDALLPWLCGPGSKEPIEAIFHLGASSATTETDVDYLVQNNLNYSVALWRVATERRIPFIYASSAATYGSGAQGFAEEQVDKLQPLNPYGFSKQKFDEWALSQSKAPPFWAGLKFFNVYGPQEYHKGSQASVIPQFVPQVQKDGAIRLFRSYHKDYPDGGQLRDFIYVKDCAAVITHLYQHHRQAKSGLYNVGSGQARSFADLAKAVFSAMSIMPPNIEYIAMPEALQGQYQYYTEANVERLRRHGLFEAPLMTLEEGVTEYVRDYLLADDRYL